MKRVTSLLAGIVSLLALLSMPAVAQATMDCSECLATCTGVCVRNQGNECFCFRKLKPIPPEDLVPALPPISQNPKVAVKVVKASAKLAKMLTKCAVKVVLGKKEAADGGAACEAKAKAKHDAMMATIQNVRARSALSCGVDAFTVQNIAREFVRSSLAAAAVCPTDCATVCAADAATVCAANADCAAKDCGVLSCP